MLLANEKAEKGEYCLVLDLHDVHLAEQQAAPNASLEARIFELMFSGKDMREAGDVLMAQGEKRNDVYRARTARASGSLSRCMKITKNNPFPRCRVFYPISYERLFFLRKEWLFYLLCVSSSEKFCTSS